MKEPVPGFSDSFRRLPDQTRTILVTAALSLASAGLAVAFLTLTNGLFRITYLWFATKPLGFFLVASLLTITLT